MKNKKLVAILLAGAMFMGMVGCGNNAVNGSESTSKGNVVESTRTDSATESVAEEEGIVFPLKEEVTFDVVVSISKTMDGFVDKCKFWQDLYEATNVKINLIEIDSNSNMTNLNAMFTAGKEPDAIFSAFINDSDECAMANNGLFLPLNDYLTEDIMPNFMNRVVAENPDVKGVITMPDGNIYIMPRYDALQGSYLESPFWINKSWVEKAGWKVEDIKTIDDLETVLTYFRDNDMNGNGISDDEIPYMMYDNNSQNHPEAFLGLYGIATKDGTYENYVTIKDGKVIFAPMTDAWKDAINKLADWYEKDLIWSEVFTGTSETYATKSGEGTASLIGLWNRKVAPALNSEEYVQLAPVSVEGYETEYYIHPGVKGTKGLFCLTRSCENPEILMAWLDQFYSFENSVRAMYGEEEDGRWGYNAEGKIEFYTLDTEETNRLNEETPTIKSYFVANPPGAFTVEDYEERIAITGTNAVYVENYEMYKEYLTDETWPRPYFDGNVSARMSELRTDIFATLDLKKAEWITGVADINAEYDDFIADLKKMGIEEFIDNMQKTYDVYIEGTK